VNLCSDFAQGATESSAVDVNVEFNSNLKYLRLTRAIEDIDGIGDSLLQLIRFFSSFAESNRLEEIELLVNNIHYDHGPVDWSLWHGIDQLLAGARFKCLQKIDIDTWRIGHKPPELMGDLVRWSPLLGESGILAVN